VVARGEAKVTGVAGGGWRVDSWADSWAILGRFFGEGRKLEGKLAPASSAAHGQRGWTTLLYIFSALSLSFLTAEMERKAPQLTLGYPFPHFTSPAGPLARWPTRN